jgi:hypothetical protein
MSIHTIPPKTTSFFWGVAIERAGYRPEHPQVALYNAPLIYIDSEREPYEDVSEVVYVDMLMADPLLRMWHAGIRTTWSCQGAGRDRDVIYHDGYCVIEDASRTQEAVQIIGGALGVWDFSFDSLRRHRELGDVGEVIRWHVPTVSGWE